MSGNVIAVTGAGGFIGRHLLRHFRERGWTVRALVRTPEGDGQFHCNLPEKIDPCAFSGARVVVHAAYTTRPTTRDEARRVNENGSQRVLELARSAGVSRFVFLSSTSAHAGAETYYGRSKLHIERRLDPDRDLVLRCGLVLGRGGGLFDRMVGSLRRFSLVPVFGGGHQRVQTVHVEDLCLALERAVEGGLTGCHVVAHSEGIALRDLLREVARRLDRPCRLVPVPMTPILAALRTLEWTGLRLPISSENVLALRSMRVLQPSAALRSLGVALRSTAKSLDDLLGVA